MAKAFTINQTFRDLRKESAHVGRSRAGREVWRRKDGGRSAADTAAATVV